MLRHGGGRAMHAAMSGLAQALPPDADVINTWVLDSIAELQGLRAALSHALHGPDAAVAGRLGDVPERMVLVATELATNAIRHGLAPTEVRFLRTGKAGPRQSHDGVRLEWIKIEAPRLTAARRA